MGNKGVFMFISDFVGESNEYDKKLILEEKRPKSWLKSVSAFANGKGGILFFGVADDDTLIGLEDARRVSEKIRFRRQTWNFMKRTESSLLFCGYCRE